MDINMGQFYSNYNIPLIRFARLAHVTEKSLYAYEVGEKIRSDAKQRIERAVKLVIKYSLKYPVCPHNKLGDPAMDKWYDDIKDYRRRFEELLRKETFE